MTSLMKIVSGLVIAIAFQAPVWAQPPSQKAPEGAAALGGSLTPSNSDLFQAQQGNQTVENNTEKLKVNSDNQAQENINVPLVWQSELLDDQRRTESGVSIVNFDLN